MPSAGELLRDERIHRNKTLAEIADATRISRRYLEAIEIDDVGQLPGEFFYKAFIRQYARALELDEKTTNRIAAAAIPLDEPDPIPALSNIYAKPETGDSDRWRPPVGVAIALLVAVLAGGSGLYALWQKVQSQRESDKVTAAVRANSSESTSTQTVAPPEPVAPPAPTETAQNPPSPEASPSAPTSSGEMTVNVQATEPTWIQLSSEGKTLYIGTLQPSDNRQFSLNSSAKLLTGNAGGLEIGVNGKPIGSIGPRGQIRTVVFEGGNFQILQNKPATSESGAATPANSGESERRAAVEH